MPFIGALIMPWGIYASNRIVNNAFEVAQIEHVDDMERHIQRLNSYMGFLTHRLTYAIRRNLYDTIPTDIKKRIVCVLLTLIMLLSLILSLIPTRVSAASSSAIKKQIEALKNQKKELESTNAKWNEYMNERYYANSEWPEEM